MLVCLNKAFYPPNKNQKDGIQGRKGKDWRRNNIASQINWFSAKTICASCRSHLHHGQSSQWMYMIVQGPNHCTPWLATNPVYTRITYNNHNSHNWWPSSWANTFLGTLKIPLVFVSADRINSPVGVSERCLGMHLSQSPSLPIPPSHEWTVQLHK